MNVLVTLGLIAGIGLLILLLTLRQRTGRPLHLRPLLGYASLEGQVGRAVESGKRLHISLGQASLISAAGPASIAALAVLDRLAKDGCANDTPPVVTLGEGTLLPAAQGSLRRAFNQAGQSGGLETELVQFIAPESAPFAYAAGVSSIIQQDKPTGNVLVGRFGPEIAMMTEAADRQHAAQVIGTDNPVALAVAAAVTDHLLIGEELFAAGAYLEGKPAQVASLQVQDILRLIIILAILGLGISRLVTGL